MVYGCCRHKMYESFFLSEDNITRISSEFHNYLVKSKVAKNDVLIARSGSFGVASIKLDSGETNSADVIIIRCLEGKVNPCYLVTFLNCKYGVNQLLRFASGGLQGHVNLTILENLKVCTASKCFQDRIELIIHCSHAALRKSVCTYNQAHRLLLEELGITNWRSQHLLTFIRNYSDIQRTERFDADYFQPKYDEIENSLLNYPGGWDTLENLVSIKDASCIPEEQKQYQYVALADIGSNGNITECVTSLGKDLPSRARRLVETGDVIVSSVEGSVDRIALVGQSHDQALCSTGFHVLKSSKVNPETLFVLMKSIVGQLQLKKHCTRYNSNCHKKD